VELRHAVLRTGRVQVHHINFECLQPSTASSRKRMWGIDTEGNSMWLARRYPRCPTTGTGLFSLDRSLGPSLRGCLLKYSKRQGRSRNGTVPKKDSHRVLAAIPPSGRLQLLTRVSLGHGVCPANMTPDDHTAHLKIIFLYYRFVQWVLFLIVH